MTRDADDRDALVRELYPEDAPLRREGGPGQPGLHLVRPEDPAPAEPTQTFADRAREQHAAAIARGRQDLSGAPTWFCETLRDFLGPMLPTELHLVGALPSNGKSAVLLTQLEYLAEERVPVLHFPLETPAIDMRRELAAWRVGLSKVRVAQNALSTDETRRLEQELGRQIEEWPHVVFVDQPQVTLPELARLVRDAIDELGIQLVMIDYVTRLDFGSGGSRWERVVAGGRFLRDLARQREIVMLAAAQVKPSTDPLAPYLPPMPGQLAENPSGLTQDANGILMLSRVLGRRVDPKLIKQVLYDVRSAASLALPNVMRLTDRKRRLDPRSMHRSVLLMVENGRVREPWYNELKDLRRAAAAQEEAEVVAAKTPAPATPPLREPGDEDLDLPF